MYKGGLYMDWSKIWLDICNYFKSNIWNIVLFFAILLVGIIVIKVLLSVIRKILKHTKMEKIAQQFICTILKFLLWLLLILLLLSQFLFWYKIKSHPSTLTFFLFHLLRFSYNALLFYYPYNPSYLNILCKQR